MTPDEALETAKAVKMSAVADPDDNDDLRPSLVVIRAGNAVARVMLSGDSSNFLRGASAAAPLFGADVLMLITDGYAGTEKFYRERGKTIRRGQLADLWERGRTDLVTECLSICWGDREAEITVMSVPYVQNGTSVEWGERVGPTTEAGGFIPDGLRQILGKIGDSDLQSRLDLLGVPEMFDLEPGTARAHLDAAATKWLARQGFPTLVFAFDDESVRVLRESFEDAADCRVFFDGGRP